jgi:hypothetical protein
MKIIRLDGLRVVFAIALIATASVAVAQESGEMPETTPEMQAEIEAWMRLAQPGPHHEHLAPFVGS